MTPLPAPPEIIAQLEQVQHEHETAVASGDFREVFYRNIDFSIVPSGLHNLSGKVALPEPKTDYWVALTTVDQPGLATAVTETKADGSFHFEGIPAGSYTLTASGPVRGYGGKAVLDPHPYFGRSRVSVAADVDGVADAGGADDDDPGDDDPQPASTSSSATGTRARAPEAARRGRGIRASFSLATV